jgi:hypothetical protein
VLHPSPRPSGRASPLCGVGIRLRHVTIIDAHAAKRALDLYFTPLEDFARLQQRRETAVRSAFQVLLHDCARQVGWKPVPEYPLLRNSRASLRADGALVDEFNLPQRLWEAKDIADQLEKEIRKKVQLGYPRRNILFQLRDRAVLYQKGERVLASSIVKPEPLTDVLRAFLNYQEPVIVEWEKAGAEFKPNLRHRDASEAHRT